MGMGQPACLGLHEPKVITRYHSDAIVLSDERPATVLEHGVTIWV